MYHPTSVATGMDISDYYSHICTVDASGEVAEESRIRTTPEGVARHFGGRPKQHVVIEVGTHARWVAKQLKELGHEVVVANARKVRAIYENENKDDRRDAEMLARIRRMDPQLLYPVDLLEKDYGHLAVLRARDQLVALRTLDPFDSELVVVSRQVDDALSGQVEQLLARGRRGYGSGNYRSARSAFEEVLSLDDQNESARGYMAYIDAIEAEERGSDARLPRTETRLVRASDDEIRAEGYHQNALAAERAGDPYAAIRHDLRALELAPDHAGARSHLAELRGRLAPEVTRLIASGQQHYQQEELQSALDAWRRALLIDPVNEEARAYVGRAENLLQNLERLRSDPASGVGAR